MTQTRTPTELADAALETATGGMTLGYTKVEFNAPSAPGATSGDFDGKGVVDGRDFIVWRDN